MDFRLRVKLAAALACAGAVVCAGGALAAPAYSIANAPSHVPQGTVFTVDVVLDLDGYASVGHEVSVHFTPGALAANAAVELGVPPYEFQISPGVRGIDNAAGIVNQFEAVAFTAISPAAPFVVGQITFQAGEVGRATIAGFFDLGAGVLDDESQPIDDVAFDGVSVDVVPAATPSATPTPTPQITPMPENDCQCAIHKLVPVGNLAVLNGVGARGNGPKPTGQVGVVLKARERTRGACLPGSDPDTFSLQLRMVDDDGDVILDETRTGLRCERGIRVEKFTATYALEHCAGSKAPRRSSKGEVTVFAKTDAGDLIAKRTLLCIE